MRKSTSRGDNSILKERMDRTEMRNKPQLLKELNPPKYDIQAALAWWYQTHADHWWQTQMPISLNAIDAAKGVDRQLYKLLGENRTAESDQYMKWLGARIDDIENRRLVFPVPSHKPHPKFLWLEPPPGIFHISKLSEKSAWSLWARCASCENNKFLPIEIDAKPYVACYHCIKPSQYRQIGARAVKGSLIDEALKKYL